MLRILNELMVSLGFDNRITATDFYRIDSILEQIENTAMDINNSIERFNCLYNSQYNEPISKMKKDIVHLLASCKCLKRVFMGGFILL